MYERSLYFPGKGVSRYDLQRESVGRNTASFFFVSAPDTFFVLYVTIL